MKLEDTTDHDNSSAFLRMSFTKNAGQEIKPKIAGHMPQLDGLRALAVLSIMCVHWVCNFNVLETPLADIGVQLFFVLSGFLITGILLDTRRANGEARVGFSLRQFYVRRALRIFPLFYLTLAILLILNVPPIREVWKWYASYLCNIFFYLQGFHFTGGHFWTLAVEEQFYFLFPLLILLTPSKHISSAILFVIAMAPLYRSLADPRASIEFHGYWLMLPSSMDSFGCGALLAWGARHLSQASQRKCAYALLLMGVSIYAISQLTGCLGVAKKTCVAFCLGYVVWCGSMGVPGIIGRLLEYPLMSYVGKISYGLYVIHAFIPGAWSWLMYSAPIPGYRIMFRLHVPPSFYGNPIVERMAWLLLTFLLAAISFRYFESPINNLKRFFPYSLRSAEKST